MSTETLDPVAINQLTWLTSKQAQIYLKMSHPVFQEFCARRAIPYQSDDHSQKTAKRRFYRPLLDKGMLDDMKENISGAVSGAARERISTILGAKQ